MPVDIVDRWLRSGRPACVSGTRLHPVEHRNLQGMPLSIRRGQAEAFPLTDENGTWWILKKFHPGRAPDRRYLEAIQGLLPDGAAFASGTARQVLFPDSLAGEPGCHYTPALAQWLDGTVLMPKIPGSDWATLSDDIRSGNFRLERPHRLALCRSLAGLVEDLEQNDCAHRDFSSGNVFITVKHCTVSLIDFDSLYHPTLPMPEETTCGTEGYAAPFGWQNGIVDARRSWCPFADRFALAILNTEFLVLGERAPLAGEGGIFPQDQLCARSGQALDLAFSELRAQYPSALPLFEAAIRSRTFENCPSSEDWNNFVDAMPDAPVKPPRLEELEPITLDLFERPLRSRRPAAPIWPAPRLAEMPLEGMHLPTGSAHAVSLPPDPWRP